MIRDNTTMDSSEEYCQRKIRYQVQIIESGVPNKAVISYISDSLKLNIDLYPGKNDISNDNFITTLHFASRVCENWSTNLDRL